ncbi:hypothetical protein D3C86_2103130 [compost metagenome]
MNSGISTTWIGIMIPHKNKNSTLWLHLNDIFSITKAAMALNKITSTMVVTATIRLLEK